MKTLTITSARTLEPIKLKISKSLGKGAFGKVAQCDANICEPLEDNEELTFNLKKAHICEQDRINDLYAEEECKEYAVKEIDTNKVPIALVSKEIKMLAHISKQCQEFLLCIKDYGYIKRGRKIDESKYYIVLELLDKNDGWLELGDFIEKSIRISSVHIDNLIPKIINKLCEGLLVLHGMQVVHLDIKPENIFVNVLDQNNIRIKYIDFGVSSEFSESNISCVQNSIVGTSAYFDISAYDYGIMCPYSDFFSLGMTIIELIHKFRLHDEFYITESNSKRVKSHIILNYGPSNNIMNKIRPNNKKFDSIMANVNYNCNFFDQNALHRYIKIKSTGTGTSFTIPPPAKYDTSIPFDMKDMKPEKNKRTGNSPPLPPPHYDLTKPSDMIKTQIKRTGKSPPQYDLMKPSDMNTKQIKRTGKSPLSDNNASPLMTENASRLMAVNAPADNAARLMAVNSPADNAVRLIANNAPADNAARLMANNVFPPVPAQIRTNVPTQNLIAPTIPSVHPCATRIGEIDVNCIQTVSSNQIVYDGANYMQIDIVDFIQNWKKNSSIHIIKKTEIKEGSTVLYLSYNYYGAIQSIMKLGESVFIISFDLYQKIGVDIKNLLKGVTYYARISTQRGAPLNGAPLNGAPLNGAPLNGAPLNGAPLNGGKSRRSRLRRRNNKSRRHCRPHRKTENK
jgi:serine/threonine protein kinase